MTALTDAALRAAGLELRSPGIWFSSRRASVSYPHDGNATCLQIEDRSFWFRHRNQCIASLVMRWPPDGPFLDIGGGNGYVAQGLVRAGVSCALVEPGLDGALAAHARGIDPVICASLEDLDLPDASIGAAGMFDVLEHIADEVAAIAAVRRLIRPGGCLFVTVPAYPWLFSGDDVAAGHFRRHTLGSLASSLGQGGFRLCAASYIFMPLPPLVFLARTLPGRLGLRAPADAGRIAAEHRSDGPLAWLMQRLLDMELRMLIRGWSLPFGGSCLAVATPA